MLALSNTIAYHVKRRVMGEKWCARTALGGNKRRERERAKEI
jgi:hypothetical protein